MSKETARAIQRLDRQIGKLAAKREEFLRQRAREEGWAPCGDCFNGYCSMNCSTAPGYIKVYL